MHGMVYYGMVWYGMALNGMEWNRVAKVCNRVWPVCYDVMCHGMI